MTSADQLGLDWRSPWGKVFLTTKKETHRRDCVFLLHWRGRVPHGTITTILKLDEDAADMQGIETGK